MVYFPDDHLYPLLPPRFDVIALPLFYPLRSPHGIFDIRRMHLQFLAALLLLAHSTLAANNFYGIDISSFNSNSQCRSAGSFCSGGILVVPRVDPFHPLAEWDSIVSNAKNNGYRRFRVYGNDCGTPNFASVSDDPDMCRHYI